METRPVSVLTRSLITWFPTAAAGDVSPERVIGCPLPFLKSPNDSRALRRARKTRADSSHHGLSVFICLLSRWRLRLPKAVKAWHRINFFPINGPARCPLIRWRRHFTATNLICFILDLTLVFCFVIFSYLLLTVEENPSCSYAFLLKLLNRQINPGRSAGSPSGLGGPLIGPRQSRVESIMCTITGRVDFCGPRRSKILIRCGSKETEDLVFKNLLCGRFCFHLVGCLVFGVVERLEAGWVEE